MTCCKKLYAISELLEDDMSIVATAIKLFIKEEHYLILRNISNNNIDRYQQPIDVLYDMIEDHYNIDGVVALISYIHAHTEHGSDDVGQSVLSKDIIGDSYQNDEQMSLFDINDESIY